MADMIRLNNDFTFDSGPQPISINPSLQEICRVRIWGRRVLASVIIVGGSILDFQILQAAYPDDPNPLIIADGSGFNSPALADESYILPALSLPLGPAVFQVHLQGDACELIFKASGQALGIGSSALTVQVKGSCSKIGIV